MPWSPGGVRGVPSPACILPFIASIVRPDVATTPPSYLPSPPTRRAACTAVGARSLSQFLSILRHNVAFPSDYPNGKVRGHITVAGAIATSTHGSGACRVLRPSCSGFVVGAVCIVLVTAAEITTRSMRNGSGQFQRQGVFVFMAAEAPPSPGPPPTRCPPPRARARGKEPCCFPTR